MIFFFKYSSNLDIFLKEHLRKAAEATCTYFNIMALISKYKGAYIQHRIKHFFSEKLLDI